MTISRFEELMAWQKARLLARLIYSLTATERFAKDYKFSALRSP